MINLIDRPARRPNARRLTLICLAAIAVGTAVGIAVPAGTGWDFANFYDTGRRVAAGQVEDIYEPSSLIAGEVPQGRMRFWGTPASAILYAPLSRLSPPTALIAFKSAGALALFAGLGLLFLHLSPLRRPGEDAWSVAALFSVLALVYQPLWTVFRVGGQTTPAVFLLLVLALLAHTRGRFIVSASLLVLAVAVKPFLVVGLGFLVLTSGRRFLASVAAVGAIVAAVSIATLGWPVHSAFLTQIFQGSATFKPWVFNSALTLPISYLVHLVPDGSGAEWPGIIGFTLRLAAVAALFLACLRLVGNDRARELPEPGRRHLRFLTAVAFALFASPIVWEHYLSLLLPLLLYAVAVRRELSRNARLALWWVFGLSLGQNLILVLALNRAIGSGHGALDLGISFLKSGPLLVTAWFLLRHGRELQDTYVWAGDSLARPLGAVMRTLRAELVDPVREAPA